MSAGLPARPPRKPEVDAIRIRVGSEGLGVDESDLSSS